VTARVVALPLPEDANRDVFVGRSRQSTTRVFGTETGSEFSRSSPLYASPGDRGSDDSFGVRNFVRSFNDVSTSGVGDVISRCSVKPEKGLFSIERLLAK